MPPEAKDNLIWTSLLTILAAIGTPSSSWLTAPIVEEVIPPDAIPPVDVNPRIYLDHLRTGAPPTGQNAGTTHSWRTQFDAYIAAKDKRTVNRVRSDILRAVYGGEGSLTTAYAQPAWPGPEDFTHRDDLSRAGVLIGLQPLFIDHATDHTAT
jgi:hypothetical protein